MKSKLLFSVLFFSIVFASCKKDDPVDYRDAFVGTYSGIYTYTNYGYTGTFLDVHVDVSKSSISDTEMYLKAPFYVDDPTVYNVKIDNVVIDVEKNGSFSGSYMSSFPGYSLTVTVSGKFSTNMITYTFEAKDYPTVSVTANIR